jgi:hypothetical protein
MKKIILCLMATYFSLAFLPVQMNASTTAVSDSLVVSKLPEKEELIRRFNRTRDNGKTKLNQSDKKNSQDIDTGDGRQHRNGMNKGMYVSVGCTFLLMILVIILI